jgi:hypothetical protein
VIAARRSSSFEPSLSSTNHIVGKQSSLKYSLDMAFLRDAIPLFNTHSYRLFHLFSHPLHQLHLRAQIPVFSTQP